MKVYLISKGEHDDYHICAVTLDPQEAVTLQGIYSDRWCSAEIEVYDTEHYKPLLDGSRFFEVTLDIYGTFRTCVEADDQDTKEQIDMDGSAVYMTVFAKDTDAAIKSATSNLKQYLNDNF